MFEDILKGTKAGKRKGRSTSGEFFGLHIYKGAPKPSQLREERKSQRRQVEKLERKSLLQSAKATLQEQKARTRIAKRAGRVGRRRSYRGLSRKIGMRLI